jgi:hypothetical protein
VWHSGNLAEFLEAAVSYLLLYCKYNSLENKTGEVGTFFGVRKKYTA